MVTRTRFIQLASVVFLAFIVTACSSTPDATTPSTPGVEPTPRTVTAAPLPAETDWEFWEETAASEISGCIRYAAITTSDTYDPDYKMIGYAETSSTRGSRHFFVNAKHSEGGEQIIRSSVASLKLEHPEATFTIEADSAISTPEVGGFQDSISVYLTPYQRGVLLGNPQDTIATIIGEDDSRSIMFEGDAWAWLSHAAVCLEGVNSD